MDKYGYIIINILFTNHSQTDSKAFKTHILTSFKSYPALIITA